MIWNLHGTYKGNNDWSNQMYPRSLALTQFQRTEFWCILRHYSDILSRRPIYVKVVIIDTNPSHWATLCSYDTNEHIWSQRVTWEAVFSFLHVDQTQVVKLGGGLYPLSCLRGHNLVFWDWVFQWDLRHLEIRLGWPASELQGFPTLPGLGL